MKKVVLLKFSLLFIINSYAQTLSFTLANPQPSIAEAYAGAFASGDIDGDGDKDLFMSGLMPGKQTKLYLNDGLGNFTEITTSTFPRSSSGQAILKDLDKDGDLDLFYSGNNHLNQNFTNIYRNNGFGIFTQVINNALPIFLKGAAIDDVDNDGDQDIVISTSTVADVYLNNGNAFFTPLGSAAFTPVSGVVQFIDMENDGDKDVIISGRDASNVSSIKLYQNNGFGNFTLNTNSTFAALLGEDIDVADTDNDGDLDFLVNGNNQNLLYINNGSGIFTQITTTLQPTSGGQNAITDLDNDGDQDMLIVGTQPSGLPNIYNIVYRNTGNNVFIPVDTLGGEYIADCVVDNFNGDNLKDIIIQGFAFKTNVYWNTSSNPVPLQLLSFTGKLSDKNILLNWTTANEVNTDYFIIERSINGVSFSNDGTVSSMNNPSIIHNYQYQVKNQANGLNYFRLKMVDKDGKFSYSNIIKIQTGAVNTFSVLGNPVKDNLSITGLKRGATLALYDNAGKMVLQKNIQDQSFSLDLSFLSSGVYYLKYSNNGSIESKQIIKQ
jgi:hypothetical protein